MKKISLIGIFIWSLAVLFLFYEFFSRIFLGTIAKEVMHDLHISIVQFGAIGAAYYLAYGLMQMPVGILTEKIGARITLSVACCICAIGMFWLEFSYSFYPALFSRVLVGFGSAFALVSLLILALNWFPRQYFGLFCSIALVLGAVGPILAGGPLAYIHDLFGGDWRLILFWVGSFGIILSLCLALFIRNKPEERKAERSLFEGSPSPIKKQWSGLFKNRQAWLVAIYSGALYVSLPLLSAYWGTTYLETRGFPKTRAAFIISMVWVGFSLGNLFVGKCSEVIKRRKPFLSYFSLLGMVATIYILYLPIPYEFLWILLFFLVGLATAPLGVAYAVIIEVTPRNLHAAALGFKNTLVMLLAGIIPFVVSYLIHHSFQSSEKITLTESQFLVGFTIMPLAYAVAAAIAHFGIKETYCVSIIPGEASLEDPLKLDHIAP